jgi:hypothetical protein
MRVNKPPPKMKIAYARQIIVSMVNEGAFDEIRRNHRLSEKDTDEELFFTCFDILIPIHD